MAQGSIRFIIAGLLIIAMLDLPYGYYTFLRIVVTLYAIVLSTTAIKNKRYNSTYLMAGFAILFNPIIPIYFAKDIWFIIDIITAGIFVFIPKLVERNEVN